MNKKINPFEALSDALAVASYALKEIQELLDMEDDEKDEPEEPAETDEQIEECFISALAKAIEDTSGARVSVRKISIERDEEDE